MAQEQTRPQVSVIIPTLNPGEQISELLDALRSQTVEAELVVVDSGSQDGSVAALEQQDNVRLLRIPPESFDHGGTRDMALRQTAGTYVAFFTQDALPADNRCLEQLIGAFENPNVAGVFGRQIARPDAPAYERLTREFNYPAEGRVWREADIERLGVKAYFFSDVCAAWRREAYETAGGFDAPVESNEDMLMAAKLLHNGYALAYEPSAVVLHSHSFTLREDFERNLRIGRVMERYRERLRGESSNSEGMRMLRFVCAHLAREGRPFSLLAFVAHCAARFAGNRVGRRQERRREQTGIR